MFTITRPFSLAEYLSYNDGTERRYELVNGELVAMPSESDLNNAIAMYLIGVFLQVVPILRLRRGTEVAVMGAGATVRIPDLLVLSEGLAAALAGASRSIVTLEMPPPILAVEIVSPGKENEDCDYRYKRSEYGARGILEYWIVDPSQSRITMLTLVDGLYEEAVFQGGQRLISVTFPALELMAEQILQAGQ
ncbi:MAG: Uma2 family endonuclease [Cyanobacteriota bacterium]|nr:Uma2 family endonuclease [Cyanobacteriota bacterium]